MNTVTFKPLNIKPLSLFTKEQQEKATKIQFSELTDKEKTFLKESCTEGETFVKVYEFTVNKEFLDKCPNPEDYSMEDLFCKYKVTDSMHNNDGPAWVNIPENFKFFFRNGKQIVGEEFDKLIEKHGGRK